MECEKSPVQPGSYTEAMSKRQYSTALNVLEAGGKLHVLKIGHYNTKEAVYREC